MTKSLASSAPPVLGVCGLSKDYGPIRVVNGIRMEVQAGTIHALLGENGAGKSTLIKMLAGVIASDDGHIEVDGVPQNARSVKEAQKLGIVALPQELTLVQTLGASENIFLGKREPGSRGLFNRRRLDSHAAEQLARLGQSIPLRTPIRELSAVQQTMVALARALAWDARVLILDEPTAALTDTETEQLFAVLRKLRAAGTAIIYVSHRLEEVFQLADVATVMRNGSLVWTKPIETITSDAVVAAMIGRSQDEVFPARSLYPGVEILRVEQLHGYRLKGVTLSVSSGRVLGIAGLAGAGRSELLKIMAGVQKPASGTVLLNGAPLPLGSVKKTMKAGVALVPEERRSQGLIMTESIQGNIALANLEAISRFGVADRAKEKGMADAKVRELRIKAVSVRQPVSELSGGNQQKVVLAKYLQRQPEVLLLDEPTRGIDVGTKAEIYALIRQLADAGVAVVVVSSEIPELLGVTDEIAVLHEGSLVGVLPTDQADEEMILRYCYRKLNDVVSN